MNSLTASALRDYKRRARALKCIGFSRYEDYLASELWAEIRAERLTEDPECYGCAMPATQVHHVTYEVGVLLGTLSRSELRQKLRTVCKECHESSEYFCGVKVGPKEATALLEKRRRLREERNHGHQF